MATRILLVEDQILIRKSLSALIKTHHPEWEIFEAGNGNQAVTMASESLPDVILMDYRMPKMDGLKATSLITKDNPDIKIIMVSAEDNNEFTFDSLDAGASGIVPKVASDAELLRALRIVIGGQLYFPGLTPEELSLYFFEKNKKRIPSKHLQSALLSDRELEILNLIAKGNSAAEIADQLFISRRTVEAHKANILKKCNVASTADLIRFAIGKNLISI